MKTKPIGTEVDGRKVTELDVQSPEAVLNAVLEQQAADAQEAYRQISELRALNYELLEALKAMVRTCVIDSGKGRDEEGWQAFDLAEAAIAKAEGQS